MAEAGLMTYQDLVGAEGVPGWGRSRWVGGFDLQSDCGVADPTMSMSTPVYVDEHALTGAVVR